MEWKEYVENHNTILKNSIKAETSQLISKNIPEKQTKRGNFILRQDIKSLTIFCTVKVSFIFNSLIFVLLIALGIYILALSKNVKECSLKYDNCTLNPLSQTCQINFSLNETFAQPVHFFYELRNFYSNHRVYVRSRSWSQLNGTKVNVDSIKTNCNNMYLNSDLLQLFPDAHGINGETLSPSSTLNPAGLIAAYHFTDDFSVTDENGSEVDIDHSNITYQIDRAYFKTLPENQDESQWVDVANEKFISWMYMETFPQFKKKWGKINFDLMAGNYTLTVDYNWNFPNFETEKYFVILSGVEHTVNPFFGYALIVSGGIYFIAMIVLVLTGSNQKKFLCPEDLKWE